MPALDIHVSGLAGRRSEQRRGAVRVRELGVAACLRAAARRRYGRVIVAPRPSCRAHPVQPMASQAEAVRAGGPIRRIGGDPAGRSLPDLGRADAPRERHRASPSAAGMAALRRHAHRAGPGPVRRSRKRCPRPAVDGRCAGGGTAQVGQLHRAPAVGDRCSNERLQRSHHLGPGPLRRSGGRSVPAARRLAGGIRCRNGHRQAQRPRPHRTQGHQCRHRRTPPGRSVHPQAVHRLDERRRTSTTAPSSAGAP